MVLFSVCLALSLPVVARADISGVIRVIDGDTFDVGGHRVRLYGIDAPEAKQTCTSPDGAVWTCGAWVSSTVRKRYQSKAARCSQIDTDRYERIVARCFVDGSDVAQSLVRAGLAFAYTRYAMDYVQDELIAAKASAGLHASDVQSPEAFRHTRRVAVEPPKRACTIKGTFHEVAHGSITDPASVTIMRPASPSKKGSAGFVHRVKPKLLGGVPQNGDF